MKKSALLVLLLLSITSQAKDPIPVKITGLKSPESVVQDKEGIIYITEIGEFGKDGDGQVSQVDKKGNVKVFAKGMDDPKGITLLNGKLYVADKLRVLEVNADGTWQVYGAQMAFPSTPVFLNDIVADKLGNLYVSDSGNLKEGGQIFKIAKNGVISMVVDSQNPDIKAPNGLWFEGRDNLLSVDFETGILYRVNLNDGKTTKIAEGFGGGDGIVKTKTGKLYISDWKNGIINQLSGGKARILSSGFSNPADIALSQNGKYLLVPIMKTGELEFVSIE